MEPVKLSFDEARDYIFSSKITRKVTGYNKYDSVTKEYEYTVIYLTPEEKQILDTVRKAEAG